MPCQYYSPEEERRMAEKRASTYKAELDRSTRLLCEVISNLPPERVALLAQTVDGLAEWWYEHQAMDSARVAQERKVGA